MCLDPGERGAGAEAGTVSERDVRPCLPAWVQAVGIGEYGRVTVGGSKCHEHLLALADDHVAQRRIASGHPGGKLNGAVVMEELLDSVADKVRGGLVSSG